MVNDLVNKQNLMEVSQPNDQESTLVGLNSTKEVAPYEDISLHSLTPNNNRKSLVIILLWILSFLIGLLHLRNP